MQQPQPLGDHLLGKEIDSGRVAARPSEARDETKLDGVFANAENDRNGRCRSFGGVRGHAPGRDDHGHLAADQIIHQAWQTIVFALHPMVLDRQILTFEVASFAETPAESGHVVPGSLRRPISDKPDYWQGYLLPAQGERPRGRSAP